VVAYADGATMVDDGKQSSLFNSGLLSPLFKENVSIVKCEVRVGMVYDGKYDFFPYSHKRVIAVRELLPPSTAASAPVFTPEFDSIATTEYSKSHPDLGYDSEKVIQKNDGYLVCCPRKFKNQIQPYLENRATRLKVLQSNTASFFSRFLVKFKEGRLDEAKKLRCVHFSG
jgi:hypothetical protein